MALDLFFGSGSVKFRMMSFSSGMVLKMSSDMTRWVRNWWNFWMRWCWVLKLAHISYRMSPAANMSTFSVRHTGWLAFLAIWIYYIVCSGAWYIGVPAQMESSLLCSWSSSHSLMQDLLLIFSADICLHPRREAFKCFLFKSSFVCWMFIELQVWRSARLKLFLFSPWISCCSSC